MQYGNSLSVAVVALALACPAGAALAQDAAGEKWQSVAKTDLQEAFVNTSSIATVGGQLEARVKQNYAAAQPAAKKGKSYLSTRSLYRFDCAQRKIGMKELRAYSGADLQGEVVQKATSKDKNMQWLPAEERTVFGELLDYVCRPAGTG
jgi:hypothetical protein